MQRTIILCLVTLAVAIGIAAQTPPAKADLPPDHEGPVNTTEIGRGGGNVLNNKATSLPKPPYPAAARAVGASGAVSVQVLIDENGDVVSATAVSGHPLLRAAAAQAARGAKFSPTQLSGIPVKVAGIITYNFVGPLVPARLAFLLSVGERSGSFGRHVYPKSLAHQLPEDWIQEREILSSMTFAGVITSVMKSEVTQSATNTPKDPNRYTASGSPIVSMPGTSAKLSPQSVLSLQKLIELVETRSSANPSLAWSHELGKVLGFLVVDIEDQSKLETNLTRIETHVANAPATVRQSSLEFVREFVVFAKTESVSDAGRQGIAEKAEALSNLRY